jgi:FkbM family methyltransferase
MLRIQRSVLRTRDGQFWVDPATLIGQELIKKGVFSREILSELQQQLPPGGTFVDLGAHEGYFTVIGAKLAGAAGRVIAIEPQDRLISVIQKNLELNSVLEVSIVHAAISNFRGTISLMLSPDINTGSSGLSNIMRYRLPCQETEVKTLSDVFSELQLGQVDCMKVDIEGAEAEALLGSPDIFRDHRVKALLLELHPRQLAKRGHSADEVSCSCRLMATSAA